MTSVWLVCGGRDFTDQQFLEETLDSIVAKFGRPELVISGGAAGADTGAMRWAVANKIRRRVFSADWARHGKAAGMIRNARMLVEGRPDLVVAFRGGRGTENMVNQAREAGVAIVKVL
jgi:predicted Rossmann-fold nucleotide-binding protein